jgi:hypothetical protein
VALDLPEGVLAAIAAELDTMTGRLDLAVNRLADALDPVGMTAGRGRTGDGSLS